LIASKGKFKPNSKPKISTPYPTPKSLVSKSTPEKEKPTCSYYGKLGHVIEKCYKKMKDDKKKKKYKSSPISRKYLNSLGKRDSILYI